MAIRYKLPSLPGCWVPVLRPKEVSKGSVGYVSRIISRVHQSKETGT